MQLRYYTNVVRHWLWLLLLGTSLCACATFIISNHLSPTYQANTLLQVNGTGTTDSSSVFANQALAVSYALLITSNDVLTQVVQQVPDTDLPTLQTNVSASPEESTQIIQIRANAHSAMQATRIANTVAQVFIALQVKKMLVPLQNQSNQLSNLLATQRAQVDSDETQLNALQASNASTDALTQQRNKLADDQASYNATLTNYQQVQLQILATANVISQVQVATPPSSPISPHVTLNTLVAALLGLLLSLTLALVLDWLDTSIKTVEDVTHLTSLVPLGSIAHATLSPLVPGMVVTAIAEETMERDFIAISTTLCKMVQERGPRALLVTGTQSGVGTTLTATYLALTLAQMGQRVLLVDADIRQPLLHELFLRQNMKGLVNSLSEVYHFRQDVVQSWRDQWLTHIPNLWLLPAGPPSSHPPTILRSQELSLLLSWLLGEQTTPPMLDFILFDTPALKDHADTLALASVVPATLLVIEAGKEREEALMATEETLRRIGAPILGVIINQQTARHHSSIYARNAYMQRKASLAATTSESVNAAATPIPSSTLRLRPPMTVDTPPMTVDTPPTELQSVGSRLFSRERDRSSAISTFSIIQPFRNMATPPPLQSVRNKQFIRR